MKLFGGKGGARDESKKHPLAPAADFLEALFDKKAVRVIVIILAVLGVTAIGVTTWWRVTVKPPEPPEEYEDVTDAPTFDMAEPVKPKPVEQEVVETAPVSEYQNGCYTVVLAGVTGNGDLNTDTLMVGKLDTVNKTLNVVSIPRDTMVNVKRNVKKINSAYPMGSSNGVESGVRQLMTELKSILGFKPGYYAIVNMDGFVKLVDAMGGVTYNVPQNMYKDTGDMVINLEKGEQKLSGKQALQLVRYRGYDSGQFRDDYGRMHTQQDFLKVIAKQLMSLGNLFKINEFVNIAKENLQTNLDIGDMIWFGQELLSYGMDNISFYTLPTTPGKYNSTAYVYINEEEALKLINETINPFTRDITGEDLDILILKS